MFEANTSLQIGTVVEVAGTTVRVRLSDSVDELIRSHAGRVYPIGQIGSVVKIHYGRKSIFGFVNVLRMETDDPSTANSVQSPFEHRMMEIELFAEGVWDATANALNFRRGVSTFPLPKQSVHLVTREEAHALYQAAERTRPTVASPLVPFATYLASSGVDCRANIDKMFGLHCAVLGSTGSGKSGAVAAILHGVLEHTPATGSKCHPRIIILDPHGEYKRAFGHRAICYRAYDPIGTEPEEGTSIYLPFWLMSAEEFRLLLIGKTEQEATSQNNIVYKALTHARMCHEGLVNPAPSAHGTAAPSDGMEPDAPRAKDGVDRKRIEGFDRDKPRPFSLQEVENHIRYLQAARVANNVLQSVTPSDFAAKFRSILDKLDVLRLDPRIRFIMDDRLRDGITLDKVLEQLLGDKGEGKDVRVIDLSGLPNEVAGPLAAMLARLLFQYKLYQTAEERRRDPVLLVCEEAHRYVPDRGEAEYAAAQTAIRRIAREGRKYGLGLMLVSQRPADIEGTVISQCGTWVVMRLTNASDQQHVARFLPDNLAGMTKSLPALGEREALFVGEGAALPAKVKVFELTEDKLPRSETVAFAAGWMNPRFALSEIAAVATRMSADLVVPDSAVALGRDVGRTLNDPPVPLPPATPNITAVIKKKTAKGS